MCIRDRVGANRALGLSGHPPVRLETMATARLYRQGGELIAVLPAVLEEDTFYLADDPRLLTDVVTAEVHLLMRRWRGDGCPLLLVPIPAVAFRQDPEAFLELGHRLQGGDLEGVPVRLGPLSELAGRACLSELPRQAIAACGLGPSPRTLLPPITSCLLYTSPSPRDATLSRMPSSA